MLTNAFEWERLVHPDPTDDMVALRKAVVTGILASFDSEQDVNDAVRLVAAAITGLSPSVQADVQYAAQLTAATKKHHEAFPSQLSENALDLQLSACLAVGEILTRKNVKGTWREPLLAVAAMCISGSRLQPTTAGKHLKAVCDALAASAKALLARHSVSVRQRPQLDLSELEEFAPPGDLPGFWNQLQPILTAAFESVTRASEIDRDELEVLWWLYNDDSSIFGRSLSTLGPFDTALTSSVELVDRALTPAPPSLNGIISGLVLRSAGKSKPTAKGIKSIISSWSSDIVGAIVPDDDVARGIAKDAPKVLPLTWIAVRIAESGVTSGWEDEFQARTGIPAGTKLSAAALADQVFAERTAQRLLCDLSGD